MKTVRRLDRLFAWELFSCSVFADGLKWPSLSCDRWMAGMIDSWKGRSLFPYTNSAEDACRARPASKVFTNDSRSGFFSSTLSKSWCLPISARCHQLLFLSHYYFAHMGTPTTLNRKILWSRRWLVFAPIEAAKHHSRSREWGGRLAFHYFFVFFLFVRRKVTPFHPSGKIHWQKIYRRP